MRMIISQTESFAAVIFMGTAMKTKFADGKPAGQETNADGVPKWQVQLSLAPRPIPGAKIQDKPELINVNVTAERDPGEGLAPGMPVAIDGLSLGTVKGNVFYTASGISAQGAAPAASKAKADA